MNVRQEQINDLYAAKVVTRDDESLGGVGQVYLDDHTGEPSWVSVKTGWFGTNESLVPLDGADLTGDTLRVAHTKETIKDAPNVDADDHLSTQDQDELFRYYGGTGMDVSRYGTRDGVGDTTSQQTGRHDDQIIGGGAGHRDHDQHGRDEHHRGGEHRDREGSMTLHEEQVDVGKEQVQKGRVGLRKHVVTEQKNVTVPVQREEVEMVREPVTGDEAHDGARLGDDETEVTLHEERPVVDKDVVATEKVGLEKQTVTDEQQVSTDVSREEVDVDREGMGVSDDRRHDDPRHGA